MVFRIVMALCGLLCLPLAFTAATHLFNGAWLFSGTVAGALTVTGLAAWYVFGAHEGSANLRWWRTVRMAMIVGSLTLIIGFVGPIIVMPDANLGPLIGLLGTGPGGFAVGAVIGLVHAFRDPDSGI